ncbi:winged helix-turn-helix transcriptional regulator [Conexibacter woesei]|uniref:winged helix-turn-helix transcriptional regulator n=1 Tax=Conexibacter woesei TaxID=191495 RepID=UPI0004090C4E|nr:winged helix-turn-helix transcriptional regulator [Conexibacter woesei]
MTTAASSAEEIRALCPRFHYAVELIGARWSGAIVRAVLDGRHRYSEIRAVIPSVSDTMLAQRLRALEAEGLLERRVATGAPGPLRAEYHLTEKGAALAPVIEALKAWAHEWVPDASLPDTKDIKNASCPSCT